ncbi:MULTISPECIES: hypothetical protein [unclassified Streptomyces]|uniref:Uncharacterized protein n=1 Tax=Streptomyces sp. 900105245 TaxID=3154379 RepID=A0ABV1UK48_9ACTN
MPRPARGIRMSGPALKNADHARQLMGSSAPTRARRPAPVDRAGARGGFLVDPNRRDGGPAEVRIRGGGGTMTSVGYAGTSRTARMRPVGSVTVRDLAR